MTEYIYLAHHGIKGQKWGVRRYQNPDGTLTSQGRQRYRDSEYLSESAYNARKNGTSSSRARVSTGSSSGASRGRQSYRDSEYLSELEYNTRRNGMSSQSRGVSSGGGEDPVQSAIDLYEQGLVSREYLDEVIANNGINRIPVHVVTSNSEMLSSARAFCSNIVSAASASLSSIVSSAGSAIRSAVNFIKGLFDSTPTFKNNGLVSSMGSGKHVHIRTNRH